MRAARKLSRNSSLRMGAISIARPARTCGSKQMQSLADHPVNPGDLMPVAVMPAILEPQLASFSQQYSPILQAAIAADHSCLPAHLLTYIAPLRAEQRCDGRRPRRRELCNVYHHD